MKKTVLVLSVMLFICSFVSAQDYQDPVTFDTSNGLYYNMKPFTSVGSAQIGEAIGNCRFGTLLGGGYNIEEMFSVGGESGLYFMYWPYGDIKPIFLDVPLRGFADLHIGQILALRIYGGGVFSIEWTDAFYASLVPEVGARVSLGGLYLEADYIFSRVSFPRFGIGYTMITGEE